MQNLENFKEYCREYITERLDEYENDEFGDVYELANALTEYDNSNGSFTYSTYYAKEYIKKWYDSVGEFLEEYELSYGESLQTNAFAEPEKFHAIMVIIGIENMLSNLNSIPQESFTLTNELIESIKKELSELNVNE
jgi:hypothetical protein